MNDDDDGCDDVVGDGCYRDHQDRRDDRHLDVGDRHQEQGLRRHQGEEHRLRRHQGGRSHQGGLQDGLQERGHVHRDREVAGWACQIHSLVDLAEVEWAYQTPSEARLMGQDGEVLRPCP